MKPEMPKYVIFFTTLFILTGIFLLFSIIFSLVYTGTGSFFADLMIAPGAFLFSGFSLAAFYIPCFLFVGAFLLIKYPSETERLFVLVLTMIPFLTSALFLQVVFPDKVQGSFPADFIADSIGAWPGALLLFSLLAGEIIAIYFCALYFRNQSAVKVRNQYAGKSAGFYLDFDENGNKREFILNYRRMIENNGEAGGLKNEAGNFGDKAKEARSLRGEAGNFKDDADASMNRKQGKTKLRIGLPGKVKPEEKKKMLSLPEPKQKQIGEDNFIFPLLPLKNRESEKLTAGKPENIGDADIVSPAIDNHLDPDTIEDAVVVDVEEEKFSAGSKFPDVSDIVDRNCSQDENSPIDEKKLKECMDQSDISGKNESGKPITKKPVKKKYQPYNIPVDGILKDYGDHNYWTIDDDSRRSSQILMDTLKEFKITAEVTGIRKGPVITMFEILPAPGVKLSRIVNLADNIALRLAASRVRIVAPIPGKHAVGIEVPNKKRAIVSFKEIVALDLFREKKHRIPIALGKDIAGEAQIIDLVQTPHLLIAGATGSGKSVCVNSIICSILYRSSPDEVKLLLIDPKIVELKFYNDIPHLLTPVITNPQKAYQALQYCICEMERRYSLLDAVGVRDTESFNRKIVKKNLTISKLPYIVIIIDEFADLIATTGKEMEQTIARLAAMSRAVGIHLVLATQRPSVDVITGLIKANIPSRIAFMVASKFDSRIIIDCVGAEKLLGKGDMLLTTAWDPFPQRLQGAYLIEEEVEAVVGCVKTFGEPDYIDDEIFIEEDEEEEVFFGESDPLMDQALEIVVLKGKASASYLQRRLKIGYNRAARLVEDMEKRGIVGPPNGSKPREILHVPERKVSGSEE